jgi:parvulin-like peptidyl-prolyl isomerase
MAATLRKIFPLSLGLVFIVASFAFGQEVSDPVVARAGSLFVSEREFQERFELTPGLYRHRKPQLEQEKLTLLYSMIAEKLLAQEALSRGLDTTAFFRSAYGDLVKLVARDELYRREVRQKVDVTAGEIAEGMRRIRQQLLVDFLCFPDESSARFVRSQFRTGKDFQRYSIDTSMRATRDTATVIWGDADTTIENAAYHLAVNELSPVVRAGEGWYILRLRRAERSKIYSDMSLPTLRERVLARIRVRKEAVRENEFMRELLRGRPSSSPPALFRSVAEAITAVFRRHYSPPSMSLDIQMSGEVLGLLAGKESDTLIVAGDRAWSVAEAVTRLVSRGFSVSGDSVRGVASRLYSVFREWAMQELLAEEALARGLDRSQEVQSQAAPWRDHYLAGTTEHAIHERCNVTDAEVSAYMHNADTTLPVPEVQLRVLRTADGLQMQEAFQFMERGGSFEGAVKKFSVNPDAQQGGITPFFAVTDRPPFGMIASRLQPGQFYGPIRDSTGFSYFQLLQKRDAPHGIDTSFTNRFARASQDLLRMKQRRAVTLFTAQSAESRGYQVFSDRLTSVSVTPIPMLSYRMLGFGGRMFASPFVTPRLEWLDVEAPKEKILP